jgi:hypothetical protein
MKKAGLYYLLPILVLILASLACDLPIGAATPHENISATETMRVLATRVAGTLEPQEESGGDASSGEIPEAENGGSPQAGDTPTITMTPTLGAPIVHVSVDTNCRFGPGNVYEYQGALLVGEEASVTGKLADESFWYIENPDPPPPYCWIWAAYAQVEGNTSGLPILTPPPTPTETPIPMDFSVSLDTAKNCMGVWGVFLRVENTGSVVFHSFYVTMTDSDLGETATNDENWFADSKSCMPMNPPDSLPSGAGSFVAAFPFSADSTGHSVTATVRLCTQDGLGGECMQKNVSGVVPSP